MWNAEAPIPEDLVEAMAEAGMAGLEADHSDHTPEQREHYRDLATRLGLIVTGGSDCHGTRYDPVRLGSVTTDPDRFRALRSLATTG
jgi:predicted metal-dependent phosphoesterase TrpH